MPTEPPMTEPLAARIRRVLIHATYAPAETAGYGNTVKRRGSMPQGADQ